MEVAVENAEGLQRRLKVQIPAARMEQAIEEKIRRVGQHAKIAGFRPGKVPLKVLYQRYGERARYEAASELVEAAYPEALQEVDLKPAGQPKVELGEYHPGQDLAFTATFDVYPEIELQGLDAITVARPKVTVTDADVDTALERLRERHTEHREVERASMDGDRAVIDYVGRIDGEAFEGGSGDDVDVVLGEGRFLPDLERAIVGRKPGEAFDVPVTFPEDYNAKELAGKTAEFHVEVKTVSEPVIPELDEAFLKKLGIEEGGVDALRAKIRESIEHEAEQAAAGRVKSQVMDAVHQANPIDVPASMVDTEVVRMRKETAARLGPQAQELDDEQLAQMMPDEVLREGAERRVALGLLLAEVIAAKEIKLDADKVEARLDDVASQYGEQGEQVRQYYRSNRQMMQGIEAMVMEEQVIDTLLEQAKVTDEDTTLDALLNPQAPEK